MSEHTAPDALREISSPAPALDPAPTPSPSITPPLGPLAAADIHGLLRGQITTGLLGTGERLPSIRQLARDLGVANGTVAKAYTLLEADGMVVSRTSAGTRVAPGATSLPEPVVARIRELVALAREHHVDIADVGTALQANWQAVIETP